MGKGAKEEREAEIKLHEGYEVWKLGGRVYLRRSQGES